MINPNTLKPFGKFCVTLGMLPSSYKASLTYEEQLLWLCNYIETKVIPAVNNNAEALEEVQALYEELRKFIIEYFAHLDVQEEIDSKLDEMAEDGTLDDIINQNIFDELNLQVQQNTSDITSLKNATSDFVVFGDSWSDLSVSESVWSSNVATQLHLTLHNYAISGARIYCPFG